jgi:3alpha(or 20beta)-hydroxysteroid dehydrogenase
MNAAAIAPTPFDYLKAARVDGKVALVTGAARGLGAEMAKALAAGGARVMVTDVLEAAGRETVAEIVAAGGHADFLRLDTTQEAQWEATIAATVARLGGLDVLVNNAGIERLQFITETTVEEFRQVMDVNVTGVFLGCKHAVRTMRPGGAAGSGGSIVNLSSVAGLVGCIGLNSYCASKGAVRMLTKSVAVECGQLKLGIRCNSVHPGVVWTAMGRDLLQHFVDLKIVPDVDAAQKAFEAAIPAGHLGAPSDIASAVLYLASDAARWVTGAELAIDGGYTAV